MADQIAASIASARDVFERHGYASALLAISTWLRDAAFRPNMDMDTIMAMNAEIERLARMNQCEPAARQLGEFTDHIVQGLTAKQPDPNPAQPVSELRGCDSASVNNQERRDGGLSPANTVNPLRTAGGSPGPSADGAA